MEHFNCLPLCILLEHTVNDMLIYMVDYITPSIPLLDCRNDNIYKAFTVPSIRDINPLVYRILAALMRSFSFSVSHHLMVYIGERIIWNHKDNWSLSLMLFRNCLILWKHYVFRPTWKWKKIWNKWWKYLQKKWQKVN